MTAVRCECGRYAKLHSCIMNYNDDILKVKVNCSRCGVRDTTKWESYEQIIGYGE